MSSTTEDLRRQFSGMLLAGRYRLDELVGHGGMGAVFRGTDERLEREVAVKVIQVEDATEPVPSRQRFIREARMAARIQHPNVVTVHDFGTAVDPEIGHQLDYIVMELLRGESLAEWLPHHSGTDLAILSEIFVQAARGVAAGHRAGVVHRDVKPRNLIVLPGDGTQRLVVRVVDFGIAKPRPGVAVTGDITVGHGFVGSSRYASPEQLQGRSDLEPESDVFSLGVVGYELLAGSPPYTEADRTRLSQLLHVPLRPPTVLNPAIPEAVEKVLLRCLQLDPRERYTDADALVTALEEAWRTAGADRTEIDSTMLLGKGIPVDPSPDDRRGHPASPVSSRWRPGVRTWAAAAAAAGVIALGALTSGDATGSMMSLVGVWFGERTPRDLLAGTPLQGALGRGDSTLSPDVRFDVYRYRGPAGEPLTLALESGDFEGALEWGRVLDGRWEPLESSGTDRPVRIAVTVADTAEYRVRVRALRPGARGRYTVTVMPGLRSLSPTAGPVASRLGPADNRLAEGVWYEEWTFRGSPGEQVNFTVDPDSFAARIEWGRLMEGRWQRLEDAVSDGTGYDARLTATLLDNGEYRVRVRNRREQQRGLYTLRVSSGAREVQPGAEPSSQLSGADAASGSAPAELWVYRGATGEPVTLAVRSASLPTVLEWGRFTDGRWVPMAAAGTSDTTPALRIRPPATEEYFVRVRASRAGEAGRYTLSAVVDPPFAGVVRFGEPTYGALTDSDPRKQGKYYEEWFFSGTPGQEVTITLESGQIDPVLTFGCWTAAGVWEEIDRDDDSLFSRNAMIVARLGGTGECAIRAASYYPPGESEQWAGTGSYILRVTGSIAG